MDITKEELLKIAEQSSLKLSEQEAVLFVGQIKTILDYSEQLQQVDFAKEAESVRNANILREDTTVPCNAEKILEQAPETDGSHFVVPKILD